MAVASLDGDLRAVIDAIRVIDTLEHLDLEEVRLARAIDFSLLFSPQTAWDLISAGMAAAEMARFLAPETAAEDKWRLVAPYWPLIRLSGYARAVQCAARDLYAISELSAETHAALTEAMRQANRPGVHRRFLSERAGIDLCLIHALDGPGIVFRDHTDAGLFRQDLAVDAFLVNALPVEDLARQSGLTVGSLRELLRVIDWSFARYGDRAVAIATQCAQWRTLRFDDVSQGQAETLFERGYVAQEGLSSSETKTLQDFLFHYCVQRAGDYRLPVKIHTGYPGGNNRVDMTRIRATDLVPLFRKYPQARFVLLHMGYPYQHEVLALAKHFSNVYVDLSASWALDGDATRRFVFQWLTVAPVNKLFASAGSAFSAEIAYGHSRLARDGLCRVLTEALAEGLLSRQEAEAVASRFLRENAWAAFRLGDKSGS
jgi:uncharacterized protein